MGSLLRLCKTGPNQPPATRRAANHSEWLREIPPNTCPAGELRQKKDRAEKHQTHHDHQRPPFSGLSQLHLHLPILQLELQAIPQIDGRPITSHYPLFSYLLFSFFSFSFSFGAIRPFVPISFANSLIVTMSPDVRLHVSWLSRVVLLFSCLSHAFYIPGAYLTWALPRTWPWCEISSTDRFFQAIQYETTAMARIFLS